MAKLDLTPDDIRRRETQRIAQKYDPSNKNYKYSSKTPYQSLKEKDELWTIPRYGVDLTPSKPSVYRKAGDPEPTGEDYANAVNAYIASRQRTKPAAQSRNPRSTYYNPNWQKEISEKKAAQRTAANAAYEKRMAEHQANMEKLKAQITATMRSSLWASDFDKYSEIGKAKAAEDEKKYNFNFRTPQDRAARRGEAYSSHDMTSTEMLDWMGDYERDTYYYLLGKEPHRAQSFLDSMADTVNYRKGQHLGEYMSGRGFKAGSALAGGLSSAGSGIRNAASALFKGEAAPTSANEYASQKVRESIDSTFWRGLYDIVYTGANMLPSIGVSLFSGGLGASPTVASLLGSATLGTSAGGNAYKEGRDSGYSHGEALAYGALTGASEAGLQAVLGGISKLGLGLTEKSIGGAIGKALGKVMKNKGVANAIGAYIANMGSEATEEYLQSVLEPVFKNIAAGERNSIDPLDEEAIYSGILGALTAGLFGIRKLAAGISGARNTGVDFYTSHELRTAQEAASRFFTPEEMSDPDKLNTRMKEYAREYADVRNQANPDPARQSELADIQAAYNDIKSAVNPRGNISPEQATQTAPQSNVAQGVENNTPSAANTAETPVATRETAASATVQQPDARISNAAKTALENITKAGELNTPYEAVVDAYRDKIESGVISAQDVSDAYSAGLAQYNKANSVQTENINIQENSLRGNAADGIMSADEKGAILQYKSGSTSYVLNEKMYSGAELSESEKALADKLDKALNKLPNYKGITYRVLSFDRQGKEAYDAFIARHVPDMPVNYGAYTSSSKTPDGYDIDCALKVKIEIDGFSGKDVSKGFGLETENEVIHGRTIDYITKSVETIQDGVTVIKIKEANFDDENILAVRKESVDSSAKSKNPQVRAVQEVEGSKRAEQAGVRGVPERDTQSGIQGGSRSLQGELSGGQRNAGDTGKRVSTTENKASKGTEFNSSLLFDPSDGKGHAATTISGKAVSVGGIIRADSETKVKLSDGTTAPLSDIDFDDPDISALYERAASFDVNTANALIYNYSAETSVDNYLRAFNSVYLSGKAGLSYEQAVGRSLYARHYLNDGAKAAAYRAGQAAYNAARANSIAGQNGGNIRPQAKGKYKAGVNREYSDRKLTSSQRKQIRALDEVFKAAGKKLVIHDAIGTDGNSVTFSRSDANAYYDAKTDTYHLSLDSTGQAYAYVVAHESIHEMEVKNKEGFSALSEVVEAAIEGELMNQKGMTFDEAKAEFEKMVQYQIDKNGLSRSEAVTEVVANTVPVILTDEQQGKRFADKVMKSGSKVKAWFEKLIKDLRAILDKAYNILKGQKSWEQMELIRNNKQTLDIIADYYFDGMEGIRDTAAAGDKGVKFSPRLDTDFAENIDFDKNYATVANMQPVANVKGTEFAKGEVDLVTQVSEFFESIGGEVENPELGTIKLDRKAVKDDIAHGIGRKKAAAFAAVPDVIRNGKILDVQYNWKARGYDTVVVAAPIEFSGQEAIEGVILRKTNKDDSFYLHEVYLEGVSTFKTGANKIGNPSADTPSLISILQKVSDYKEKSPDNVKLSAKESNADIREVNPMEITPPNRVTSSSKYHYLINEFENNGYNGRRVVLVENGNDGYQALTGSHRILAAREAGVDVPSVVIPMSEEIQPLLDATGDEERARIADELYEDGIIPKEARDLLVREDELNFENAGKPLDKQVRFSEKDTEQKAVSTFGTTYSWNETGYLTPSGKQLDFSGKRDGAQAGYRSMDHRDVSELYDAEGVSGTDAMIKFMSEGNIRISPEMGGINLQSLPTKAQFDKLQSFVRKNGGEVTIDFDDANGNTLHSIEYPQGTGPVRINNDIKRYYNEGKVPEISETQRFSFSRKDDVSVTPEDAKKLQKQNDKLKQALEVARQEIKLSDGHHVNPSAVERLASRLLRDYSSKMNKAELVSNITELFDYIGNGEDVVWDEVQAGAMNIALNVLDQSAKRNTEWYDATKPAREFLKKNTIRLNEKQLAEVQHVYGSYSAFRRELGSKVNLSRTDGISLEQAWRDLASMFPDTFDPDTPDVDMPVFLHDEVLNMYDRPVENPFGYDMKGYAADLAMQLYGEYMAMPERKTFADKQQRKLEMQRARYNTLMEQQRENATAKYNKLRDQRDIAKYRTSIEKNANTLYSWLAKPNNNKHVPEALRNKVAALLSTLDFGGSKGNRWKDAMASLQNWMLLVDRAKNDPDIDNPLIEFAPELVDQMQSLVESAGNYNSLKDMPVAELRKLSQILAAVKHTVTTANTVIVDGRRQYIADVGNAVIDAAQMKRPKMRKFLREHPWAYKAAHTASKFFNSGNIKPIYFFDDIGGELQTLFNDVRQASYKAALMANDIRADYAEIKEKYHYKDWAKKRGDMLTIQTKDGKDVVINREQALDIYATAKREKIIGTEHLTQDGFVFDKDIVVKNGELVETATMDNTNKPLGKNALAAISDWLTDEQKGYADALVEYMSTKGSQLGNEVTMQLYGINRYTEGYYIPLMSARQFMSAQAGQANANVKSWKNKGFTKNTVAGARNPVVITGITQKALQHMADMTLYNTMTIPQDTLLKVFNYKRRGTNGTVNVRPELDKAYGSHTSTYIQTFIDDLSGGLTIDPRENGMAKMVSSFRRNAVSGNLRVAIQQPSAIVRATALIPEKYFFGRVDKGTYERAKKYSGTAVIKEIGGFDAYTGKGMVEWIADNNEVNFDTVRDAAAGWLPQKMDEITWCRIWKACENEIADTTAYARGSEEFYRAVGHRFDDVIEYTQVYDSVISRSDWMRNKSVAMKLVTSFKAEPTTTYNMWWYAVKHMNEKGGRARLLRTMASLIGNALFNAMLKSIIDAVRDEDENQNYLDKFVEAVADNLTGGSLKKIPYIGQYIYIGGELDAISALPFVSEIVSMLQGYRTQRSEFALLQGIINAADAWDNDKLDTADKIKKSVHAIAAVFGVPTGAIERDWLGVAKEVYKTVTGRQPELSGNIMYEIREGMGIKQEVELYKGVDIAITRGDYTRLEKQFKTMVQRSTADDPMKNARETVRDAVRQYFDAHEVNAGNAKRILVKCGYGMDDAENLIMKWDFWRDFPVDHDKSIENNTEKLAAKYFELAEPVGVDKAVFYDIYKFNGAASADKDKNGKSIQNSKRDKVADYINKQSLTKAQKDAMYLACGYAKSSLDEAPWR